MNALRMRRIYRDASMRLLFDLVALSRGEEDAGSNREVGADYGLVRRAAESSACLYRSLRLRPSARLSWVKQRPAAHPVLLAQEDGLGAPLPALANLLAASIAKQFEELAAAVTFAGKLATARVWMTSELVHTTPVASYAALLDIVEKLLKKRKVFDDAPFFHVIVAASGRPDDIPASFRAPERPRWVPRRKGSDGEGQPIKKPAVGFDRIVYLTQNLPESAPTEWVNLLAEAVRPLRGDGKEFDPQGPYFGSFVATLVPGKAVRSVEPIKFETKAVDSELHTAASRRTEAPAGWRLWRDACRLPLDVQELGGPWRSSENPDDSSVKEYVSPQLKAEGVGPFLSRWARAVTNRQVGIALSGGGASSYRLVPLLRGLAQSEVPIDVLSGVSGGALLGAYYCALGEKGLDRYIDRGLQFQLAMFTAIVQPNRVRDLVNADLGSVAIGDTDVRFVAVTTALLEDAPPETRMAIAGTLGDAAQASGAAPVLFKPVQVDGERFSDGATASLIPCRILRDCGADFVFAFNCLPGPPKRNPIDDRLGGDFVYERTLLGRLIDLWVSSGSMIQRASRETCEDAHVFFEPGHNQLFLIESVQFYRAAELAEKTEDTDEAIEDCKNTWQRLRLGGFSMNEIPPASGASSGTGPRLVTRSAAARRSGKRNKKPPR